MKALDIKRETKDAKLFIWLGIGAFAVGYLSLILFRNFTFGVAFCFLGVASWLIAGVSIVLIEIEKLRLELKRRLKK